jgi:hypothetical protein
MRISNPALRLLPISLLGIALFGLSLPPTNFHSHGQTRERTVTNPQLEVIKTDVDLVTVDALVLQKSTARVVGDLSRDDFIISEDGKPQDITHFSQGSLPLSVMLLIDRGGCLDPFGSHVRRSGRRVSRLKPTDEVAVMTYHNNAELLQPFTRDRWPISLP